MNIKDLLAKREAMQQHAEPVAEIEIDLNDVTDKLSPDLLADPMIAEAVRIFGEEIKDHPAGGTDLTRKDVIRKPEDHAE